MQSINAFSFTAVYIPKTDHPSVFTYTTMYFKIYSILLLDLFKGKKCQGSPIWMNLGLTSHQVDADSTGLLTDVPSGSKILCSVK